VPLNLPFTFDWKAPDYDAVFRERARRLHWLRDPIAGTARVAALRQHYRDNPVDFINDWGMTFDPRNADIDDPLRPGMKLPTTLPFLLFPRQEDWIHWFMERRARQERGITEKTRDMGMSWLCVAMADHTALFTPGGAVGMGSRKEDYVDCSADPDSLFWKARFFLGYLPDEFRGGFDHKRDSSHMLIEIPDTGGTISGEAGDNIGRGGRKLWYLVDEAMHIQRPMLVENSLSANTNCRQDVSSVAGLGNPIAQLRHSGRVPVFTFHWRDDPRKDDSWYAKKCAELDPVTIAQEYDINYSASATGIIIPSTWVQAAVDAHLKLGVEPTGTRLAAMDVADEGKDKNAQAGRHGILVDHLDEWTGKGADIFASVQHVFTTCDAWGVNGFIYDSDGLGAGVRGDARVINEQRREVAWRQLTVSPFRGSGAVHKPDSEMVKDRKNKDMFLNAKAQAWWALRIRFQMTHRALELQAAGQDWREHISPEAIISLSSELPLLARLTMELSQPTYSQMTSGKFIVDKAPEGTVSPNLADAVMILFNPAGSASEVWAALAAA
jgi:phage terminase large subunit